MKGIRIKNLLYEHSSSKNFSKDNMLRISTKGRYALRVMLDLARYAGEQPVSLREISIRQSIPVKYLENIMIELVRSELVNSLRGKSGGYRLNADLEKCTVGRVLKCVEKDMAPIACLSEEAPVCPRSADCETLPYWKGLHRVIDSYLEGTTLVDLLRGKDENDG